MELTIYPKKCSSSGKGISKGFVVGEEFYSTQYQADLECKKHGFMDYEEAYQENFAYYTEYDDESEILEQGFGFLTNGDKIYITPQAKIKAHIEQFDDEIEYVKQHCKNMFPDYEGDITDILEGIAENYGDENLDFEGTENFGYEQGAYYKLKEQKEKFIELWND